jgi:8-oxo-dGTP pyrophosphatase MutT (NUDIX family)
MLTKKNSHCSYCGTAFAEARWPRRCAHCGNVSYVNPIPVAVLLVPVDDAVLCIRRGPGGAGAGKLALPGGFVDAGETWQEAAVRELREEANVYVEAGDVTDMYARSTDNGLILLFGRTPVLSAKMLPPFAQSDEVTDRVLLRSPAELAFPLHTAALAAHFDARVSGRAKIA